MRPISHTAAVVKICKQFIADWFITSISEKTDKKKFGLLKGTSKTHAMLSLIHHMLSKTDSLGNVIRRFLLDFAKAFDHIHHAIHLGKLALMVVPQL